MMNNFNNTFSFDPSKQHSDMPPNYKPELDITDICNNDEKAQYYQLISDMQWALALGRINIMYANVALSRYHPALQKCHLAKIQHLYGYLNKCPFMSIKFNTKMPSYDNLKTTEGNWGNLYTN